MHEFLPLKTVNNYLIQNGNGPNGYNQWEIK